MCRVSSPPFPIPWRVVDGGMKSTAMIHFRASTRCMTKQAKPTGTDGVGQRWTSCGTPHFGIGHVLTVMDDATQAQLVEMQKLINVHSPVITTNTILQQLVY